MANQEIERKFLVKGDFKPFVTKKTKIVQGFLSTVPERTVRVRIKDDQGFLTVKGIGNKSGASRFEFEKEISVADAQDLMEICVRLTSTWRRRAGSPFNPVLSSG